MKRALKEKYKNVNLSNGQLREFNTIDITDSNVEFYIKKGFEFIFVQIKKSK